MFEELKEKITNQLVLSLPKRERKFRVEVDTSEHAIGGVLSQEQDGKWKPIAFLSRTMQPAVLRSMPPGNSIDMGKGYDNNDWLH